MLIPIKYKCSNCKKEGYANTTQESLVLNYKCKCETEGSIFLSVDYRAGIKILYKSLYELNEANDYDLSIILSAIAFESELAYIFFKINDISFDFALPFEELEKQLRKYRTIENKINKISELLHSKGIDDFVHKDPKFRDDISKNFPSLIIGNLSKCFQENLFFPRNKIIHAGRSDFTYKEALKCFNIASIGIVIFREMDKRFQLPEK